MRLHLRYEMMAGMKVACICALLIASSSAQSGPTLHNCHISVFDSEGAVIGKAHLFVHRDPIATTTVPDGTLDADTNGRLEVALPNGFYDVCVMSPAFTPTCRKLIVRSQDVDMKFRLSASPEVLEQIGDKFPTQ
jgi:hypothetical protein